MFEDLDLKIATELVLGTDWLTSTCPSLRVCLQTQTNCCTKK